MIILKQNIKAFKYCVLFITLAVLIVSCKQGGHEEAIEHENGHEHEEEHAPHSMESVQRRTLNETTPALTIGQITKDSSLLTLDTVFSGEIEETMDVQGYTYMKLKDAADSVWVAVSTPPQGVHKGDHVVITRAAVMKDFYSKSLDKTFDTIIFGQITEQKLEGHPSASQTMGHAPTKQDEIKVGSVPKAEGDDAYTVAEIFADKDNLENKDVVLRGVVVRYSEGILGMNWLHIQDGTGTAEGKDNDLTVTTTAQSKVGNTVLVTGKLHINKSVGPGYFYDAIIEDANVTVEKEG